MYSIPLLALLCGLLLSLYKFIIYPAFLSPLAKIPNAHFSSGFSPVWILWKRYTGAENQTIHEVHQKKGPIVRLGPTDISINCVEGGIKTVYSGGFGKPNWYPNVFFNFGATNLFSMKSGKQHSVQKRMISHVYSKSYLQSSDELHSITDKIMYSRYLPLLHSKATSNTPVDVHELNFAVTMDTINAYMFGLSNSSNFIEDAKTRQYLLHEYQCRRPYIFYDQELPGLTTIFSRFGISLVPKWADEATQTIEDFCMKMCNAARSSIESGTNVSLENTPTVYKTLYQSFAPHKSDAPSTSDPHNDPNLRIASELLDQIAAGHETSGVTTTYAIYSLSRNPSLQSALRKELLTLSRPISYPPQIHNDKQSLPSPRAIDALPLLHAILMETLRLYAPIPGPQPRETPYTGVSLAGSPPLPGGVRVSAQAYSLHRNPDVFPEPEMWRPERWLATEDEGKEGRDRREEMGRWFWAFGSGGRMCVGNNFAMQEMKLLLATIYSNYTTDIVDASGIEMRDAYTSGPEGNRLIVQFEHAGS